jgi:4-amino-4-deoxy-L-arabinose transferase-like glycosyltransferase
LAESLTQPEPASRPVRPAAGALVHPRLAWLVVVGLALGTIALRLPYLDVPISADEGGYATAAYWWARGDTLYENITITRPQGIFVVFRLIDALGLGTVRGIHLFAAAWVALAMLALFWLVARLWGRAVALAAAVLFAVVMATPWMQGYSANAELFMTLPLLLGLGALLRSDDSPLGDRRALAWIAASGLAGAVALLLKPSGVALLPLAALWLARRWRVERAAPRRWLLAEGMLLLGWAAGLLPALVHGLLTAPDRYLGAVIFYRVGQDSLIGGALSHQIDYFLTNTFYLVGHLPILLFAPFGLALAAHDGDRRARAFLALWLLTALGGTALGGNWFLHYYQQLLPPLAIATVLTGRRLLRLPISLPRFAGACLAALALLVVLLPVARGFVAGVDPRDLPEWEPGVSAAAPVAAYLAANTAPADTIYVAYDHADIYYLAQRRPAARWLHFRELRWTPGAFDEQVARIADPATAPRYIVGAQAFDRFGFDPGGTLRAVVARDYILETTIGGLPLYRRSK